jgi:transglutaminase-like putative cysteine protease
MPLEETTSRGAPPPLAAYVAAWLLTVACVLVVQLARVTEFTTTPFLVLLTLGVSASAWASRRPLSEGARLVYGFLDGALAFLCLTGQAFLNSLFDIGVDVSIENYLSLSFLWYLCLRSALMVTINALAFQSVPALALFGLIATYMLATQILWLFVLMLLAVLFLMLASHWLEWGRAKASLETGYALRIVGLSGALAGLVAFLATPIVALTIGRAISTVVVGMPFRANLRATPSETPPELQVGAGAVELSEMEVLRVRIEGEAQPKYLRMESYSAYTGRGWNRGRVLYEEMIPLGQGKFVPPRAFDAPEHHQATATVQLTTGWHTVLYSPGFPLEVEAPVRQLHYVRWVGSVRSYRALGAGERYTVRAYYPPEDPRILRQLPSAGHRFPFLLPPSADPSHQINRQRTRVHELAERLTRDHSTQYDKVMALMRYIEQNTAYNLKVEAYPLDVDVVDYFLFEAKQGYCVEFATALAVLCRYAGIPARVASGFALLERDPETGEYVVREAHRHLWTEVYFEGVGWVAFDATRNAPEIEDGANDALIGEESHQARRRWLQRALDVLIGAVGLAILYLLIAPRLGWTRGAPTPRAQRLYGQLLFALRLLGAEPPATGQTPRAYLEDAAVRLNQRGSRVSDALRTLTPALVAYLYAPPDQSDAQEPDIARQIARIRRQTVQELGVRRLTTRLLTLGWQQLYGSQKVQ